MIKMIRMLIVLAVVLVALPAYGATFNLSWTDNSSGTKQEDGFRVERRLGQTGTFAPIVNSPTVTDATTATDLTPDNREYCYRALAFNSAGSSPWSNIACGTPVVIQIPNAPGGMTTIVLPVIIIIPLSIP